MALLIASAMLSGCGNKNAMSPEMLLYNQADSAFKAGNPDMAITLLDSLDASRPKDTEVLRLSMALRPSLIEAQTIALIARNDSIIEVNKEIVTQLKSGLKQVTLPGIEGYLTDAKQYNEHFVNTTGVSARVTENGEFYLVSSLNPAGGLKHNGISLTIGNENASTPRLASDNERRYSISGSELITFTPQESDSIGHLASLYPDKSAILHFDSPTRSKSVKLTSAQVAAIASTYDYARALNAWRDATIQQQKLNSILTLAREKKAQYAKEQEK